MEDLIMQALTDAGVENLLYRKPFPLVVVQFADNGEVQAVPQAHLSDISWCERGREREIIAEFESADALCEFIDNVA